MTSRAIVERDDQKTATVSETAAVIQLIERAAKDPSVDVDKMERLLTMRRQMIEQQAVQAFSEAMTKAQSEMRPVATDASNPQTKSKYASYLALDKALRPIYTRHGFALSFNTAEGAPDNHVRVVCDVSLGSYTKRYQVDMPADGKGAKGSDAMTKTHAVGAAMTYGQRYLLKMIFNIAVGNDDDGNSASNEAINQDQADQLRDLIESTGANIRLFLQWANVERIEDIPARHFDKAVAAIQARAKQKQGAS